MWTGGFPEPLTFSPAGPPPSRRPPRRVRRRARQPDARLRPARRPGLGAPLVTTIHHPITVDRRLDLDAADGWKRRASVRRWYGFTRMQKRVARRLPSVLTVSGSSRQEIVEHLGVRRRTASTSCTSAPTPTCSRPTRRCPRSPAGSSPPPAPTSRSRAWSTSSRRSPSSAPRTPTRTSSSSASAPRTGPVAAGHRAATGSQAPSSSSRASATPNSSTWSAAPRSPASPRCTRASRCPPPRPWPPAPRWWPPPAAPSPRSPGPTGRPASPCRPATPARWPPRSAGSSATRTLRARLGAAGRERVLARFTWAQAALGTVELLPRGHRRAGRATQAPAPATPEPCSLRPRKQAPVLTVDFTRFPLAAGDRVLDLGCGAGRHAFECYRRGAQVVALDQNGEEIREVAKWFAAMKEAGEAPAGATATAMEGDALNLPFPDDSFDVVIISEVMEHIPDDKGVLAEMVRVLRPGGRIAVTVPALRPREGLLDALRRVPRGRGRPHPHLQGGRAARQDPRGRAQAVRHPPRARAAQPLLVAEVRLRRRQRQGAARARLPQAAGLGHHEEAAGHPGRRAGCSTRSSARASWRTPPSRTCRRGPPRRGADARRPGDRTPRPARASSPPNRPPQTVPRHRSPCSARTARSPGSAATTSTRGTTSRPPWRWTRPASTTAAARAYALAGPAPERGRLLVRGLRRR